MDANERGFVPTIGWMKEKYDEMNETLFSGVLGECNFGIFTTGRGSQGRTLGRFTIKSREVRVNRYTRRMYIPGWFDEDKEYINRENFYELCKPLIELNGNYSGTEKGFTATLVHEMCHYQTYMDGFAPKQGHGVEFREIASVVSSMSNGMFSVQRLATAEEMKEFDLSDEMKAKKEKRVENIKSSTIAVLKYMNNGEIRLTTTTSSNLVYEIIRKRPEQTEKTVVSSDRRLTDKLYDMGYRKNMRTWRWWNVEDEDWIGTVDGYDSDTFDSNGKKMAKRQNNTRRRVFFINTSSGKFECDATDETTLFNSIKERFPSMSDENIRRIMDNQDNYRLTESRQESEAKLAGTEDSSIGILPNMDLGKASPFEYVLDVN